jgi:hypothetical protein
MTAAAGPPAPGSGSASWIAASDPEWTYAPTASRTVTRLNRGETRRTTCQQHLSEYVRYAGSASPTSPSSSCISARTTAGENIGPHETTTIHPIRATRPRRPTTAEALGQLSSASSRYGRHTARAGAATSSSRRSHSSRRAATASSAVTACTPSCFQRSQADRYGAVAVSLAAMALGEHPDPGASFAGTSTTGSPPATRTSSRPGARAAPVAIRVNQQVVQTLSSLTARGSKAGREERAGSSGWAAIG